MAKLPRDRVSPLNPRLDDEMMARLRAEVKAPYRGLRIFVYGVCGASGLIGAFIFLAELAAGRASAATLPNFALQVGVVALMVWLFRVEKRAEQKQIERDDRSDRS
ncbi:MAG: DUF3493 domain-containing protein [Leptolyngbya sp. DLM2.Bin15]|nr:MAG: DUF3493 domain-containing protein [Leptolyngbya sp. DLM2.Bin15]